MSESSRRSSVLERKPMSKARFTVRGPISRRSERSRKTPNWRDFDAGLREARRTLKRGGRAAFVDVYAPGQALFDTHLQAIELLRDHSHVRDYSCSQWLDALARARFAVDACRTWRLRMDFPVWIARMQTPEDNVKAIRALQNAASTETKAHFAIEPDGSFLLDMLMIEATAA